MSSNAINTSGMHPKGQKLLVRPEEVEGVTKSGIVIPIQATEKEAMAQMYGRMVEDSVTPWPDNEIWAKAGDRVVFAKYSGLLFRGDDGVEYRIIARKDLVATIDEPKAEIL